MRGRAKQTTAVVVATVVIVAVLGEPALLPLRLSFSTLQALDVASRSASRR